MQVSGQPLSLAAWVHGSGKGEWTAFTVKDANGQSRSLYGPYITWNGWKQLEVPVPPELKFPVEVTRFTAIETKADRSYQGEVIVATSPRGSRHRSRSRPHQSCATT